MGILNIDKTITEEDLLDNGFKKAIVGYYGEDETGNVAVQQFFMQNDLKNAVPQ